MKDKSRLIMIILGILLALSLAGNIYQFNNKDTDPKININKTYGGGGIDGKDVVDLTSEEYITIMDNTKIYLYRQNEPMKLGSIKLLAEPNLYIADIDGMDLYIFFNEDSINVVYDGEVYNYKQRAEGPTFLGQEGIDNIEKNDKAIFNVNSLEKLDLGTYEFGTKNRYFRDGMEVKSTDIKLAETLVYAIDKDVYLEINEVLLEPIKLTADYDSEGLINLPLDNWGYVGTDKIEPSVKKIISKYVPINYELKIDQNINVDSSMFVEDSTASLWFYPICYEITYNDNVYRILKPANMADNIEFMYMVSDGLIEVRNK